MGRRRLRRSHRSWSSKENGAGTLRCNKFGISEAALASEMGVFSAFSLSIGILQKVCRRLQDFV